MIVEKKNLDSISKKIRKLILITSNRAKSSHIGSSLSIVEILVVLYFKVISHKPKNPNFLNRDRFVLSKGHACLALYCVLAECGYYKVESLKTYGKNGSKFMTHISHKVPGVEFSTGSLGHGINYAVGKAFYAKKANKKWHTYVLISDGELNEGSTWESILFASHHKLNNLTIIIDNNQIQSLGKSKNIIDLAPLKEKFFNFQFQIFEINGHNIKSLEKYFNKKSSFTKIIIANTIKGKGIKFMENKLLWHYRSLSNIDLQKGLKELI